MAVLRIEGASARGTVARMVDFARAQQEPTLRRFRHLMTTPAPLQSASSNLTAQAQRLATELFLDSRQTSRILGITSPLGGEGKTLLSTALALSLARSTRKRTVLIEGTWQRPALPALFDLPSGPGLAEWLRGECDEASIRHAIGERLVVIPAGHGADDELLLLERLQSIGFSALAGPDDFVVVDLPCVLATGAGKLAAGLVERVLVVARASVTPLPAIVATCDHLHDHAVQGIVLNQVERWIPRWLERVL